MACILSYLTNNYYIYIYTRISIVFPQLTYAEIRRQAPSRTTTTTANSSNRGPLFACARDRSRPRHKNPLIPGRGANPHGELSLRSLHPYLPWPYWALLFFNANQWHLDNACGHPKILKSLKGHPLHSISGRTCPRSTWVVAVWKGTLAKRRHS